MFNLKPFYLSLCGLALAFTANATSPTLSMSVVSPDILRFSWPTNFTDWQLMSTTNLSSANWQAVAPAALHSGTSLVVIFPLDNASGFFRLQQTTNGSGGCVFRATPPAINAGGSSTLTWCPVAGKTYRLSPEPGVVTGGSAIVAPTVTTVYTLTASNATSFTTDFTSVIVNPCGFASVSNWVAKLGFLWEQFAVAPGFDFHIFRGANEVTFHLKKSGDGVFVYDGSPITDHVLISDVEDDSSSGSHIIYKTSTVFGPHNVVPLLSTFTLAVDCTNNNYHFAAILALEARDTTTINGQSSESRRTAIAGQIAIFPRALPIGANTLPSGTAQSPEEHIPAVGPFSIPTSDYYAPNDFIPNDMWINGVIDDGAAGPAIVWWSIAPAP